MIDAYPRYAELLREAATPRPSAARPQFTVDDLRDLQVWHKLAWIDPFYLDGDARVRGLRRQGPRLHRGRQGGAARGRARAAERVIPEYRDAAARGQIELSTSPFYHPILPLLCDTDIYLRTHPDVAGMPRQPFRHPEDAAEQLHARGRVSRAAVRPPARRAWPSEGSVSDAMVPLVAAAGLPWMATDELILARTLGADVLAGRPRAPRAARAALRAVPRSARAARRSPACSAITCCRT